MFYNRIKQKKTGGINSLHIVQKIKLIKLDFKTHAESK